MGLTPQHQHLRGLAGDGLQNVDRFVGLAQEGLAFFRIIGGFGADEFDVCDLVDGLLAQAVVA